ncbi:MAG TPA: hypothetical protein VIK53_06270 [Verrucomicrobiae bacterium]
MAGWNWSCCNSSDRIGDFSVCKSQALRFIGFMADDVESGGRSRALMWGGVLVTGLPLLYALSIGPVCLILDKTHGLGSLVSWEFMGLSTCHCFGCMTILF